MKFKLNLPEPLRGDRKRILKSKGPCIEILPGKQAATQPWASKIGGHPYLPGQQAYPAAPDGSPLWLLAQLNFEEMPHFPPFPRRGLLQFFIKDDGLYGLGLDDPFEQSGFRVVYHAEVVKNEALLQSGFSFLKKPNYLPFDPEKAYPLQFELQQELIPPSDYQFEEVLGNDFFSRFGDQQWELQAAYRRAIDPPLHKLGGYARFCQEDPRNTEYPLELLFQLSSDPAIGCMWGDMGVAHFFIHKEALARADFSQVMYNWDCY